MSEVGLFFSFCQRNGMGPPLIGKRTLRQGTSIQKMEEVLLGLLYFKPGIAYLSLAFENLYTGRKQAVLIRSQNRIILG